MDEIQKLNRCKVCNSPARYGFVKGVKTHCKTHKDQGMIDMWKRLCIVDDCMTRPSFGKDPTTYATHCKTHAKEGMVSVQKKCEHLGCGIRPSFGTEWHIPTHCKAHATEDMIDVVNKRCQHQGCNRQPHFGQKGDKPTHCQEHADCSMVDVKSKKCEFSGCNRCASFGLETGKRAYCKEHSPNGTTDLVSKKCQYPGCNIRATFGLETGKHTHCKEHATEEMSDVSHQKCQYPDCNIRPTFGREPHKATHCKEHATEDMTDVTHKKCSSCGLFRAYYKHNLCSYCFYYHFPEHRMTIKHKLKENFVVAQIKSQFVNFNWIHDQEIKGGCSKRRPDLLTEDKLTFSLIIEIDEHQHIDYTSTCENSRVMELFTVLGDRPLVVIRFNPDMYIDKSGNKHGTSLTAQLNCVKPTKEWKYREAILFQTVSDILTQVEMKKELTVIHLFYDGF